MKHPIVFRGLLVAALLACAACGPRLVGYDRGGHPIYHDRDGTRIYDYPGTDGRDPDGTLNPYGIAPPDAPGAIVEVPGTPVWKRITDLTPAERARLEGRR